MIYIGIDPGKKGSISVIDGNNKLLKLIPTPVIDREYDINSMDDIMDSILSLQSESFCVIERAQAMPGQGVVSMFEFGKGFGIWLALLTSWGISYQIIHARTWTKVMLEGAPGEGKERSLFVAKRLFPDWKPKLKKEYEYSDSLLLAEYAKRTYKGVENG